jgi:hypothetical protein
VAWNPTTDRQRARRLYAPTMMRVALVSTEQFEVAVERDQPASVSQLAEIGAKKKSRWNPNRTETMDRIGCPATKRAGPRTGPCPGAGAEAA